MSNQPKVGSEGKRWEISNTNEGLIATGPRVGAPVEVAPASEVERLREQREPGEVFGDPVHHADLRARERDEALAEVERLREAGEELYRLLPSPQRNLGKRTNDALAAWRALHPDEGP